MDPFFFGFLLVVGLVLYALLVNGWTDAPNAIVTVVSTGVLPTRVAVVMAVVFNIIGGLLGTKIAMTISQSIVDPEVLTLPAVGAAMLSIIAWGTFAGHVGLPISKSHSLLAGLAGAALACGGPDALIPSGWGIIMIGLLFSSFVGGMLGWVVATITTTGARLMAQWGGVRPKRMKGGFDILQICSATAMATSHGTNDTQKFAGAFILVLVLGGFVTKETGIPWWVNPLCALTMGIGTMFGGYRIIRTVGLRMTQLTSREGFCAEFTASSILFGLAGFGVPASTTHTINTSIVGVVASKGARFVRWDVFGRIVLAWLCTFPICFTVAFIAALAANRMFR